MAKKGRGLSIGIATIITMFTVLAMTIFAVLSVSTAKREEVLAEKYAKAVSDYWRSDGECTDIRDMLTAPGLSFEERRELAEGCGAVVAADGGDVIISYSRPSGEHTAIDVRLRLAGDKVTVERWKQVNTDADWQPNTSLPVWQGD